MRSNRQKVKNVARRQSFENQLSNGLIAVFSQRANGPTPEDPSAACSQRYCMDSCSAGAVSRWLIAWTTLTTPMQMSFRQPHLPTAWRVYS